jgi:hypothetical protein
MVERRVQRVCPGDRAADTTPACRRAGKYSSEEKIRIDLKGLQGEVSSAK